MSPVQLGPVLRLHTRSFGSTRRVHAVPLYININININIKNPFGRVEPFVFRLNFDVELVSKIEVSAIKSTKFLLGWSKLLLVMKENPDFGFLEELEIPK